MCKKLLPNLYTIRCGMECVCVMGSSCAVQCNNDVLSEKNLDKILYSFFDSNQEAAAAATSSTTHFSHIIVFFFFFAPFFPLD